MARIFFLLLATVFWCSQHTEGWVAQHLKAKHPTLDACLTSSGVTIRVGEKIQEVGTCAIAACSEEYNIAYTGCGKMATSDKDCFVTNEDPRHPYPLCCENIYCPGLGYMGYKEHQTNYTLPIPERPIDNNLVNSS